MGYGRSKIKGYDTLLREEGATKHAPEEHKFLAKGRDNLLHDVEHHVAVTTLICGARWAYKVIRASPNGGGRT